LKKQLVTLMSHDPRSSELARLAAFRIVQRQDPLQLIGAGTKSAEHSTRDGLIFSFELYPSCPRPNSAALHISHPGNSDGFDKAIVLFAAVWLNEA
jgi:hypothetical protein